MSKFVVGVGVVLLMGGAAGMWVQHRDNVSLRRDIASLRDDVRRVVSRENAAGAPRPQENAVGQSVATERRVDNRDDMAKLREDIAALRKTTQEIAQFTQMAQAGAAMKSLGATESTIATKLTPADALKNAGKATPEAATETVLWAAVGGDVDALANSFVFTPTAREKADAWFAGLSENTRKQYGTPEKVIALMIAKDAAGLTGMQVLGQKEVAPDMVGVRVRFGSIDGKTKDDNLVMRRSADGWRMMVPDNAVEKFARQLAGLK